MPFSDLPSIFEKYDIFISNYQTELELSDSSPSSASFFSSNTDLDLSPLLFLRAPVARIGIQHVTIENLCLCYLNNEQIKINFSTPPDINTANLVCTSDLIETKNLSSFNLRFGDFTATTIDECLFYINSLIGSITFLSFPVCPSAGWLVGRSVGLSLFPNPCRLL